MSRSDDRNVFFRTSRLSTMGQVPPEDVYRIVVGPLGDAKTQAEKASRFKPESVPNRQAVEVLSECYNAVFAALNKNEVQQNPAAPEDDSNSSPSYRFS